jgi:hypothetical protein
MAALLCRVVEDRTKTEMAAAAQKSGSGSKTGIGSKKDRVGSLLVRYFEVAATSAPPFFGFRCGARARKKRPRGGEPERPWRDGRYSLAGAACASSLACGSSLSRGVRITISAPLSGRRSSLSVKPSPSP